MNLFEGYAQFLEAQFVYIQGQNNVRRFLFQILL